MASAKKQPLPKTAAIRQTINVLERLEGINRRTEREDILTENSDNEVLKAVFQMALGSDKYHIRPDIDPVECTGAMGIRKTWSQFLKLTELLKTRAITGNKARDRFDRFISQAHPLMAKWCLRIMDHNLHVGVSAKTVENVFGDTFFTGSTATGASNFKFNGCMLAKAKKDLPKKHSEFSFPVGAEYKLDGDRALIFVFPKKQSVEIVSRSNKRAFHLEAVELFIDQLLDFAEDLTPDRDPVFLDGEFLARGKGWNRTSSIIRSTKNFSEKDFLDNMRVVLFDWAPLSAYESGVWDADWMFRKHELLGMLGDPDLTAFTISPRVHTFSQNIGIIGHRVFKTEVGLEKFYRHAVTAGYEGIMVKVLDGPLKVKNHRSHLIVKLKPEQDATGVIVKVLPGKGKNGPASAAEVSKAERLLGAHAHDLNDDGSYLWIVPDVSGKRLHELVGKLERAVGGGAARRVHLNDDGVVQYRYGARLGKLMVKYKGKVFGVGGGFKEKDPGDERMKLWRNRKKLLGKKVDFLYQDDKEEVAVGRFNRFVKLRFDL
jgi:hypothetical protein